MTNFIILMIFVAILIFVFLGAIGMKVANDKGLDRIKWFLICGFLPIIGFVWLSLKEQTSESMFKELHERELINASEYEEKTKS